MSSREDIGDEPLEVLVDVFSVKNVQPGSGSSPLEGHGTNLSSPFGSTTGPREGLEEKGMSEDLMQFSPLDLTSSLADPVLPSQGRNTRVASEAFGLSTPHVLDSSQPLGSLTTGGQFPPSSEHLNEGADDIQTLPQIHGASPDPTTKIINGEQTSDSEPRWSHTALPHLLEPLAVDTLEESIALAKNEVAMLRRRTDELRSLASDLLGDQYCLNTVSHSPHVYGGVSSLHGREATIVKSVVTEDERASAHLPLEAQAREVLNTITKLLSPRTWHDPQGHSPEVPQAPLTSEDLARSELHVKRALRFVSEIDELVWRRSSHSPHFGGPTREVYDEENLEALMDRLTLWEKVVRRPRK